MKYILLACFKIREAEMFFKRLVFVILVALGIFVACSVIYLADASCPNCPYPPPVETEPPIKTEPPVSTEPPATEPPIITEVPVPSEPPIEPPVETSPPPKPPDKDDDADPTPTALPKTGFMDEFSGATYVMILILFVSLIAVIRIVRYKL